MNGHKTEGTQEMEEEENLYCLYHPVEQFLQMFYLLGYFITYVITFFFHMLFSTSFS